MRLFTIVIWAGVTLAGAGAGIIIYYYATLPPCIRWEEEPYPCCTKRKSEFDCGYGLPFNGKYEYRCKNRSICVTRGTCYEKVCVERKRALAKIAEEDLEKIPKTYLSAFINPIVEEIFNHCWEAKQLLEKEEGCSPKKKKSIR